MEEQRPEYVTEEHLAYLDELRLSGVTNMYGARPYLMADFPELTKQKAKEVLNYWIDTFSDRHPD